MLFSAPERREELLWVEREGPDRYRVLSVPVWVYGVSLGTRVAAVSQPEDGPNLRFSHVLAASAGATIRFVVPAKTQASRVYLDQVLPRARQRDFHVGPATFLDPRLVAFHVHERSAWRLQAAKLLDELVNAKVVKAWEVGDPDAYPETEEGSDEDEGKGSLLTHPLPVDGESGQYLSS